FSEFCRERTIRSLPKIQKQPTSSLNSGLLLHGLIRYARAYTPSSADLPSSQSIQQQRRGKCVRPRGGLPFAAAQNSKWSLHLSRGKASRGRSAVIVGAQWG